MVADELKNKIYDYLTNVGKANYIELARRFLINKNSNIVEREAIRKRLKTIIFDDERFVLNDDFIKLKKKFLKNYLLETEFSIVDIETTGLSIYRDRIIEIAILKVKNGEIIDKYETLINPKVPISSKITKLTGINKKMVSDKPTIEEVIKDVSRFLSGSVFVAHNSDFDYKFIKYALRKHLNENFENQSLCTMRLSKKFIPNLAKSNLDAVSDYFGIIIEDRHRAMGDAIACMQIFQYILRDAIDKGFFTLQSLIDIQRARRRARPIPLTYNTDQLNNFPEKCGIYIMRDKDRKILYIGKAKNLKKRVKSYFYNVNTNPPKLIKLIQEIAYIDYVMTGSELEALLLEAKEIKKFLPPFNQKLKYPKNYNFLRINLKEDFPFVEITKRLKCDKSIYFGPFGSINTFKKCIETLKSCLKIRECKKRLKISGKNIPCMYSEMNRCSAPCNLSISRAEYRKRIIDFIKIIENDADVLKKYETQKNQSLIYALTKLSYFRETLSKAIHKNSFLTILDDVKSYQAKLMIIVEGRIEDIIIINKNNVNINELYNKIKKEYLKPVELSFDFDKEEISISNKMIRKNEIDQMMIIASYYNQNKNESYILELDKLTLKRFTSFIKKFI